MKEEFLKLLRSIVDILPHIFTSFFLNSEQLSITLNLIQLTMMQKKKHLP